MHQMSPFEMDATMGAVIIGAYRYALWRNWDEHLPRVLFVLLNPSTADAVRDDRTVQCCIRFARSWSFGSLEIVNLFAFRATNPALLRTETDPIGPLNDSYIYETATRSALIVAGWGNDGSLYSRNIAVLQLFAGREVYCLGTTKEGVPRHPLRVASNTPLVRYP
jgi:hypothetical protein